MVVVLEWGGGVSLTTKKNKICSWAANRRISRNGWRVTTKNFGSWARPSVAFTAFFFGDNSIFSRCLRLCFVVFPFSLFFLCFYVSFLFLFSFGKFAPQILPCTEIKSNHRQPL